MSIPVYDASQGYVTYAEGPPGVPVIIAGRERPNTVYCDPAVEAAWRWDDHIEALKAAEKTAPWWREVAA